MKKWANELSRKIQRKKYKIAKKLKKCSTSLATKEMQTQTTLRFLAPVRMATIKNTNNNKYWQRPGGKKKEKAYPLCTVERNVN
jgi:hypothetical protein